MSGAIGVIDGCGDVEALVVCGTVVGCGWSGGGRAVAVVDGGGV